MEWNNIKDVDKAIDDLDLQIRKLRCIKQQLESKDDLKYEIYKQHPYSSQVRAEGRAELLIQYQRETDEFSVEAFNHIMEAHVELMRAAFKYAYERNLARRPAPRDNAYFI